MEWIFYRDLSRARFWVRSTEIFDKHIDGNFLLFMLLPLYLLLFLTWGVSTCFTPRVTKGWICSTCYGEENNYPGYSSPGGCPICGEKLIPIEELMSHISMGLPPSGDGVIWYIKDREKIAHPNIASELVPKRSRKKEVE